MVRKFLAFACIALAACHTGIARAAAFVERVALFAFEAIARPSFDFRAVPSGSFAGPAFAYDGPPVHSLRHEAGMSRRAADRHT